MRLYLAFTIILSIALGSAAKCLTGQRCEGNKNAATFCDGELYCCGHTGNVTCIAGKATCSCEETFAEEQTSQLSDEQLVVKEKRDICSSNGDCASCTAVSGCGWCGSTQQCTEGSATGPSVGSCAAWDTTSATCASGAAVCAQITDCYTCSARDPCGWCSTTSTCHSGSAAGPDDSTSCAAGDFYWSSFYCDPCHSYTDCSTCTQNSAVCGWCSETQKCSSGSETGPTQGTCSAWNFEHESCFPTAVASSGSTTGTSGTTEAVTTGTTGGTTGSTGAPISAQLRDQAVGSDAPITKAMTGLSLLLALLLSLAM